MKHSFIIRSPHGYSRICIEKDVFRKLGDYLKEKHEKAQVAVITDGNVASLFHDKIKKCLPEATLLVVEPGETSKSMKVAEALCSDLLDQGFARDTVIIGLGGGMISDLAGFVASIYMRGVPFISIPTTLLAMIDASVGGKTSLNLGAKNVIGTVYPAELIMMDLDILNTLPEREMKTGVAEVIKYAAVLDASLEKILMTDKMDFVEILEKGLKTKVSVCNKDLKEKGARKVLNFGHTFGHAIETLSAYKLSHGEAISIGMTLANRIAQKLGKQSKKQGDRIEALLKKYDLPTELPKNISLLKVVEMIRKDKKMEGGKINFIISKGMGKHEIVKLSAEELTALI